jgi:predicted  nucleic acid-binding Zn-ribbon protein
MGAVGQLYELQLVDTEREKLAGRHAEITASLRDSSDLDRAFEAVKAADAVVDGLKARLRDLELEIDGLNAKLRKNQDRLYSGRVKNPKELSGLEEEAAALRRRRSELEDDQLELMIEIEEEEAELAERQARLRQIQSTRDCDVAGWQEEVVRLEQDIEELDERREDMRSYLGPGDLALYDDRRSRLGGVAVVLLKQGICQACGVNLPTGVSYAVDRGDGIHFCPTCDRLLYRGA